MNERELLLFMKGIIANAGTDLKAVMVLGQLKEILEGQGSPKTIVQLVQDTIDAIPEARNTVRQGSLTRQDVQKNLQRARVRKENEELARHYGRC